mgnify:CR=1 FL=1
MRRSRKGMKSGMKDFEAKTSPRQKMDTESWFIECYRNKYGVGVAVDNYYIMFIPHLAVGKL